MRNTKHVAIDPKTGLHLRAATGEEIAEFTRRNAGLGMLAVPVMVGGLMIDIYTGPGVSNAGAGF